MKTINNVDLADQLWQTALHLEAQWAPRQRVETYRSSANVVSHARQDLPALARAAGAPGVAALLGVEREAALAITEVCHTGTLFLLDVVRGRVAPAEQFEKIDGIDATLAGNIEDKLKVEYVEDLELAAYDGRLERLGVPAATLERIRQSVADVLAHSSRRNARHFQSLRVYGLFLRTLPPPRALPPVETVLTVDREYRQRAAQNRLARIRPHRHNPLAKTWLPIFHTNLDGYQFTAHFATNPHVDQAEEPLSRVHVHYEGDDGGGNASVTTSDSLDLRGRRVVVGREAACKEYYRGFPGPLRPRVAVVG